MTKGRLVVVEGSDASGKGTQVNLLLQELEQRGLMPRLWDFPTYGSVFGELVSRYLRGEFGSKEDIPPEVPSMLYALDRHQYKEDILRDLEAGWFLVANRYCQSNWAYQGAKFKDPAERKGFIDWLKVLESRLPQPDLVIYLHTPAEVSEQLLQNREDKEYLLGEKMDIHESDRIYQDSVAGLYLELAGENPDWAVVECAVDGKMRSTEDISREILSVLEQRGIVPVKGP